VWQQLNYSWAVATRRYSSLCVAWRYVTAAKPTHYTCNRNL